MPTQSKPKSKPKASRAKTAKDRPPRRAEPPPAEPASPPSILTRAVENAEREMSELKRVFRGYSADAGKEALEALKPRLATYPEAKLAAAKLDVHKALLAGIALHALITQTPPLLARFERQHAAGEFDVANVELLYSSAIAAFRAYDDVRYEDAFATDARVPKALIAEASALEQRMQKLCEYLFAGDPEIQPLLDLYRPGTGHRDIAHDLQGYADIYDLRPEQVASDERHYRSTDRDDATRLAGEILAHYFKVWSPETGAAYMLFRRAWTLYTEVHAEVRRVGLYLHHYNPRKDEMFPSLYAVARPPRSKGRKVATKAGAAGSGGDAGQ